MTTRPGGAWMSAMGRKGPWWWISSNGVWRRAPIGGRKGRRSCWWSYATVNATNHRVVKMDYYLSNAAPDTPLWQCAKVAKAEHRIEECLERSKSEAGLADYEVRHWTGWHHHQTLSLLATWFLERETHRGKKMDPSHNVPPDSPRHRDDLTRGMAVWDDVAYVGGTSEALAPQ